MTPVPAPTLDEPATTTRVVSGLAPEAAAQPVDGFFDRFPWTPSPHARLAQWETRAFFDRFLP